MTLAPQGPSGLDGDPGQSAVAYDRFDYTPYPKSVSQARRRAARVVAEWGQSALADDAALIVSELASNAVLHGALRGRLFRVQLTLTNAVLRIAVSDPKGERLPRTRQPTPEDKFGRGLLIVDAVAARWGVQERNIGKDVWAEFDLKRVVHVRS
ncbi:ATP-binding protein [Streptomyces zagrosensis]|uniref:Anti-sigma regulatory factor (Ser/Thr protein kinase) n=1 Tax=Streptomyces zagrosensis TaxID=1042984 RepID=A0A7W9UVR2_9ACTN|nr:ATP-binding protein [Streptomyces zagrosensis]MBB5933090.1 anti-sigma regulatory factor (Ser/Thr protein kinase) [Streptomyces zagrosensis]